MSQSTPQSLQELRVEVARRATYHGNVAKRYPENYIARVAAKELRLVERSLRRLGGGVAAGATNDPAP